MAGKETRAAGLTRRQMIYLGGMSLSAAALGNACDQVAKKTEDSLAKVDKAEAWSRLEPWIEIDYNSFEFNLRAVRRQAGVPVMAVIKADAYGHGLIPTGRYLEKFDANALMVCKISEALRLREAGVKAPIMNFGPFDRDDAEILVTNSISQSVFTDAVFALAEAAGRLEKKAGIHIHVDTGMGRAGIVYTTALHLIKKAAAHPSLKIEGVSTTLTEDPEFDTIQIQRFNSLCSQAEKLGINLGLRHAASSGGLMSTPAAYLDMIRPGIALYGYYPSDRTQEEDRLSLKPALSLKSRVHEVKTLRPGDSVSYHRAYKAAKTERIALITLGYSDGYPPQAADQAQVLIHGKRFPLIGGITSNHTQVLLGDNTSVEPGDEVVFIGRQGGDSISAFHLAKWAGISVYKVLIGLNPLLPKRVSATFG